MKRRYRELQRRVDDAIYAAIRTGIQDIPRLQQVLIDNWKDYNLGELVEAFARSELSGSKQRLRSQGKIEMRKGNEPVLMDDLSPEDVEFIDARRVSHIAGELKTRVQFNARFGRQDQAHEAMAQLKLFGFAEESSEVAEAVA